MNRSKCKKCKKWHPQLKDVKSFVSFTDSKCCKCNGFTINEVIKYEVPVIKMIRGIVILSKEDHMMLKSVIDHDKKTR